MRNPDDGDDREHGPIFGAIVGGIGGAVVGGLFGSIFRGSIVGDLLGLHKCHDCHHEKNVHAGSRCTSLNEETGLLCSCTGFKKATEERHDRD